jgi:hypothetical protein
MAQANPNHVGAQQPAMYWEHYPTMPDVMNGTYAAYLTPFRLESGEQPATLCDRVLFGANDVPKVFALVQIDPTPRIVFIHWPTRYAASLQGGQPWDDCVFGFQGNLLHGNQTNLMELPDTPFMQTTLMMVPQFEHTEAAWQAAGGADALGPFGANEPHMEQLRACSIVPIPHRYVPLCLMRAYTPQAFWMDVVGQITQDQVLQNCAILVQWA